MAKGVKTGGRTKGTPNKATVEIKEAARVHGPKMLAVLAKIAEGGESEAARVSAANAILDRAYGKPTQQLDIDADIRTAVTTIERTIVRP